MANPKPSPGRNWLIRTLTTGWALLRQFLPELPKRRWLRRLVIGLVALIAVVMLGMYGIAEWYIHSEQGIPLTYGANFSADYAASLGLNPQATMQALLNIGVRQFRLVSYWSDMEPSPGHYDFSQLDWQFAMADKAHAKIDLTLGLRQPRWPECHMPSWAVSEPQSAWQPQLENFMTAVIKRYQHNPALQTYQLENEFFLKGFGICDQIPGAESRSRLVSEFNLVKKLDPGHPVIISRSNNTLGFPVGQPRPDEYSISVYKRVWDGNVTHRYLEYPQPSWLYAFLAGAQKLTQHRDMMIGELQAEAWPPNGKTIPETSLAEQNKSLNAGRLKARFTYAKNTGMRTIDLWGGEYWYYRLKILHDPSLWNVAKQEFSQTH